MTLIHVNSNSHKHRSSGLTTDYSGSTGQTFSCKPSGSITMGMVMMTTAALWSARLGSKSRYSCVFAKSSYRVLVRASLSVCVCVCVCVCACVCVCVRVLISRTILPNVTYFSDLMLRTS